MREILRKMNAGVLRLAIPSILANITIPLVGMVDLGVAGRLGDAVAIGAMAISTMLFDLLYWNLTFLRVGTGGMVAQACGRKDYAEATKIFTQGIGTALLLAMIIWAFQYAYAEIAFKIIPCSAEVASLARKYYYIRIWAAPATLSIFVFKGFFIGMQNAISPMAVDILVNLVNLGLSILLGLKMRFGFVGIAYAITIAQYAGLVLSILLFVIHYRKFLCYVNVKTAFRLKGMGRFFKVNGNLLIRSLCFLCIYAGFTSFSAGYGDEILAVSTIMMKLLLLFSYFIDGFAYAGEALCGKFIGAGDGQSLRESIRVIFGWCFGIAIVSTICYILWGGEMVGWLTDNRQVINDASPFLPWLWIMPALSTIAFTWDGIYIGAIATHHVRNGMIVAAVGFFAGYFLLRNALGVQALYAGYMIHVIVRTIYMQGYAKRAVYSKVSVTQFDL